MHTTRPLRRTARGKAVRLAAALLDDGPVLILAALAAAGSFTHIRDTAISHGQHGWMAWAIAICIDLTCVMAARERQRDARIGRRHRGWISWPTLVLAAGVTLSLAANLAQAERTPWGWITSATPAASFLIAVSMLERRVGAGRAPNQRTAERTGDSNPAPHIRSTQAPSADPTKAPAAPPTPRSETLGRPPAETPLAGPTATTLGTPATAPAGGTAEAPLEDPQEAPSEHLGEDQPENLVRTPSRQRPQHRTDTDGIKASNPYADQPVRRRTRRDEAIRAELASLANDAERIRYAAKQLGASGTPANVRRWLGQRGYEMKVSAVKSALRRRPPQERIPDQPSEDHRGRPVPVP